MLYLFGGGTLSEGSSHIQCYNPHSRLWSILLTCRLIEAPIQPKAIYIPRWRGFLVTGFKRGAVLTMAFFCPASHTSIAIPSERWSLPDGFTSSLHLLDDSLLVQVNSAVYVMHAPVAATTLASVPQQLRDHTKPALLQPRQCIAYMCDISAYHTIDDIITPSSSSMAAAAATTTPNNDASSSSSPALPGKIEWFALPPIIDDNVIERPIGLDWCQGVTIPSHYIPIPH
jgi:hypothetical protein